MKRIVSKIDHDMYKLGQTDPNLALDLWQKIKNRSFIINYATEIIEDKKSGRKSFFAPAICHMILSNPEDIDKDLYEELLISLLKDTNLNRLTVFGNLSFLDLILINGIQEFDDFYLGLVNSEIKNKGFKLPFSLRYVRYMDVDTKKEKTMKFHSGEIDVDLSVDEAELYSKRNHIVIQDEVCFDEIDALVAFAKTNNDLDFKTICTIEELHKRLKSLKMHMAAGITQDDMAPKL